MSGHDSLVLSTRLLTEWHTKFAASWRANRRRVAPQPASLRYYIPIRPTWTCKILHRCRLLAKISHGRSAITSRRTRSYTYLPALMPSVHLLPTLISPHHVLSVFVGCIPLYRNVSFSLCLVELLDHISSGPSIAGTPST